MTSKQLVKALLDRINAYNPKVNCYITVMGKEALAQAAELDASRGRQIPRPTARHPDRAQGQHRYRRHTDHRREPHVQGPGTD